MAIFRNLCVRLIPSEAGLKILQCILAVKIFAFLDLAKNLSFSDKLPVNNGNLKLRNVLHENSYR
jgi:hypothetical protein